MTLDELRTVRNSESRTPVILMLKDGRQLVLESPPYLGITPKGVVLAVSMSGTFFLVPEQITEARMARAKAG